MKEAKLISNVPCPEKYVGYADLPNQIHRHYSMNGFDFNLLVVGESGLGKSTFVNSMFCTDIYVGASYAEKTPPIAGETMEVRSSSVTIVEQSVPLRLTMIDTPGFGDRINNADCWEKILACIDERSEKYLEWENAPRRKCLPDMRVHCCLYFVSPTGHRLKALDVELMRRLHERTNIIPVIARADSLSPEDLAQFKRRISDDLRLNGIKTYEFPDALISEDDDCARAYMKRAPFAIVASNQFADIGGRSVRCRKYPWGACEVDNPAHSDFVPLKNLLLRHCTTHLIETTHNVFYEQFRSKHLLAAYFGDSGDYAEPLEVVEAERSRQASRFDSKKKELQELLQKRQSELNAKLEEREKFNTARLLQEEADIARLTIHDSGMPHSESSRISKDTVQSEDGKKKDKKKKLF